MVDSVKSIASHIGAACYADPFLPTTDTAEASVLARAMGWLAVQISWRMSRLAVGRPPVPREQQIEMAEAGVRHYRSQSA